MTRHHSMHTITVVIGGAPYLVGICRCGYETHPSAQTVRMSCEVQEAEEAGAARRRWRELLAGEDVPREALSDALGG